MGRVPSSPSHANDRSSRSLPVKVALAYAAVAVMKTQPRSPLVAAAIGASGTYYILVRGSSRLSGPIEYKLAASGDGLSMK